MPRVYNVTSSKGYSKRKRNYLGTSRTTKAVKMIQNAFRKRKPRAMPKKATKAVKTIVKREIGRRAETFLNYGRTLYQPAQTAQNTFEGARYFLCNVGGIIDIGGQSISPMRGINAIAVNQNIAGGQSAYNQTYHGREIYGKYLRTKVKLNMPSIRTVPVGSLDWQTMPQSYEYRMIFFKTKNQPAINNATAGFTNAPFALNGFKNEVGSTFGISSTDAESLPEPFPPGALQGFVNDDLMRAPVNKTNFTVLYQKRGKISVGSSMNATSNPSSVTNGGPQYPNEANFSFTHKINKKLNLQLETDTDQPITPGNLGVTRITNYDTSICMFLVLCPLGEGLPTSNSSASTWNEAIVPWVSVHNSFSFTDM